MPYEPTNWKSGDVVTSAKLNKIEAAIGGLVITSETENDAITLGNTWQEIYDAFSGGKPVVVLLDGNRVGSVVGVFALGYTVVVCDGSPTINFNADSASGYPVYSDSEGEM